jgi:hypothetical protein
MVVELCVGNYATYDGLVNGTNGVFKTSTSYHNKTMVWILFTNKKIGVLARKKSTHLYISNIQLNSTPIEPIIKDIKFGNNQSHIITRIQVPIHQSQVLSLYELAFNVINAKRTWIIVYCYFLHTNKRTIILV